MRHHQQPSLLVCVVAAAWGLSYSPRRGTPVVGVDYGLRRVGVGVGAGWASRPLAIVQHEGNDTQVALELVEVARGEGASTFVVGLPLERNGTESVQSNLTRKFAQLLVDAAALRRLPRARVVLWDERFSSQEAEALVAHSDSPPAYIDSVAACAILDDFYANDGRDAEVLEPSPNVTRRLQQAEKATTNANLKPPTGPRLHTRPSARALRYLE